MSTFNLFPNEIDDDDNEDVADFSKLSECFEEIKTNIEKLFKKLDQTQHKALYEATNQLLTIINEIGENFQNTKSKIDDLNEQCNIISQYIIKKLIPKPQIKLLIKILNNILIINEEYGLTINMIKQYDNGSYEGDFKKGKRDGHGTYIYLNGDKYEGDFKNNVKDGKGIYTYENKDVFIGDYKDGKMNGKGIYTYIDGDKYDGEYKDDHRDGLGTYIYSNGNKYIGSWKEGRKDGKGTFYYKDGSKYVGDFYKGKKHGKGTYYCFNNDKYEGDYKNDKREGKGVFYFGGGDIYEGEFKDN